MGMSNIEGYNNDLFQIKCLKCGSVDCSIFDIEVTDEESNIIGESHHLNCNKCQNSDI